MADLRETSIEYYADSDHITWYSSEQKFITKIKKYAEEYPNEVKIIKEDDFSILAHLPKKWFKKPSPPKKMNYTPEQLEALKERMKSVGKSRAAKQ